MSTKKQSTDTRTKIDDVNEALTGLEQKVEKNKKAIMWGTVIIALIVVAVLVYVYAIRKPGIQKSNDQLGEAFCEQMFVGDSTALAMYENLAENGSYNGANLANLYAATLLYQKGEYQKAIDRIGDFSASDKLISATAESLKGDCYVNLKEYAKAIDCYDDAIDEADENPYLVPLFLAKKATVQHEMKDYKGEADTYRQIKEDYTNYYLQTARYYNVSANPTIGDIDRYIERAEAMAEKGE